MKRSRGADARAAELAMTMKAWTELCRDWRLDDVERTALLAGDDAVVTRRTIEHRVRLLLEVGRLAERVFVGEEERVAGWLRRPAHEFGGNRPLDLLSLSRTSIRGVRDFLLHLLGDRG